MQKLKQNRMISFVIITAVYLIASAIGFAVYLSLPFEWWLKLLIADIAATAVTFGFSIAFGNASVYDPYWSVQPIVILIGYAATNELTLIRLALLAAVCVWGVRLTANWAYTFADLCHQDWRYTMLKQKTGVFYPLVNLFGIHLVPTLVVYLCVVPAVYAFIHSGQWSLWFWCFICLSFAAAALQGIADKQMHSFRRQKTGGFINHGVWKYSRHPNYLGEILMWWGIGLAALSLFPHALYLLSGAAANTLLFLVVSIPMADKRQSAKPDFEQYKAHTRMLLPIKK